MKVKEDSYLHRIIQTNAQGSIVRAVSKELVPFKNVLIILRALFYFVRVFIVCCCYCLMF